MNKATLFIAFRFRPVAGPGIFATLIICLLLFLSGCYESSFPLDTAPQVALDKRLLDSWRCLVARPNIDEAAFTLTIGPSRTGFYAVTFQAPDEKPETYEVHSTLINGKPILNIIESNSKSWVFGRYQLLQSNILQVQIVDDSAMGGKYESPATLRQAIARRFKKPELFSDLCTCVRVRKPLPEGDAAKF